MSNNSESSLPTVDVGALIGTVWKGKWLVAGFTSVFAFLALAYALSLPNIYRSEARLTQAEQAGNSLSSLVQQYAGLASVAGISLGGDSDQIRYAVEVLESRRFLALLMDKHDILVPLMAAENWNEETGRLVIDDDIYDEASKVWVRDVNPPYAPEPSLEEAYELWSEQLTVNSVGSFVTISVEHVSPVIAQEWVKVVIEEINAFVKQEEVDEAQRSISYLTEELERTTIAESRSLLFDLIQRQTETIMLANVRDEYVFKTIDPPLIPLDKTGPNRLSVLILITLVGAFIGVAAVFARDYWLTKRT